MEKEAKRIKMSIIYYFGSELSIYDSLKVIADSKKQFKMENIKNLKDKKLTEDFFILDESCKDFLKLITFFSEFDNNNVIVTAKKQNVTLNSLQNLKIFIKPVKILDLYREILSKVKVNESSIDLRMERTNLSLINPRGKRIKLTEKEFKLFELLLNNTGIPLNKKSILSSVWGMKVEKVNSLNTRVLETILSKIRQKMRSNNFKVKIIKMKKGYFLENITN